MVASGRVGSNEMHIQLTCPNSGLDQPDNVTVRWRLVVTARYGFDEVKCNADVRIV